MKKLKRNIEVAKNQTPSDGSSTIDDDVRANCSDVGKGPRKQLIEDEEFSDNSKEDIPPLNDSDDDFFSLTEIYFYLYILLTLGPQVTGFTFSIKKITFTVCKHHNLRLAIRVVYVRVLTI